MAAQADKLAQAQKALTLAVSRYRAGSETLLTLLATRHTLYTAQDVAATLGAEASDSPAGPNSPWQCARAPTLQCQRVANCTPTSHASACCR